jgi:hypothetical protein
MVFRLPATLLVLGHRRRAIWLARYFKVRYGRGSDPFATEYAAFLRRLVAYDAV